VQYKFNGLCIFTDCYIFVLCCFGVTINDDNDNNTHNLFVGHVFETPDLLGAHQLSWILGANVNLI